MSLKKNPHALGLVTTSMFTTGNNPENSFTDMYQSKLTGNTQNQMLLHEKEEIAFARSKLLP